MKLLLAASMAKWLRSLFSLLLFSYINLLAVYSLGLSLRVYVRQAKFSLIILSYYIEHFDWKASGNSLYISSPNVE